MAPRRRPAAAATTPRRGILRRGSLPLSKAGATAKAKAKATTKPSPRRRSSRPRGKGLSAWKALRDFVPQVGQQLHLKGTHRGVPAECVGEVEGLLDDREGQWMKLNLTGTLNAELQEWKRSHSEGFYANRKPLAQDLDPQLDGLFCVRELREVDPLLEWKSNLLNLVGSPGELDGLAAVAQDLGYGVNPGGLGTSPPPPASRNEGGVPERQKRLKGKARIKSMIRASAWDWRGSSLDPAFRRPHIGVKRKRDRSSDSSSTSNSQDTLKGDSDQEDLFPEEAQARHISRKCPGLLTRYAIKEARKRLMTAIGEFGGDHQPGPTFLKYYRQVFSHSGASTPMRREYLTLACCLDAILEGDVLRCLDIGVQRMKAVEQISQGVSPAIANRLEIIPPENFSLASMEENRCAAQEQRREDKVRASLSPKGKGKWENSWAKTQWEDPPSKGEKGWKGGRGKDGKGKPGGKSRPQKGIPAVSSEVVAVKD